MNILFCNIGWMRNYNCQNSHDKIKGGGAWVEENRDGGETRNFSDVKGTCKGYVMTHRYWDKHKEEFCQIRIEKIGAEKDQDQISGILVIWVAKNPNPEDLSEGATKKRQSGESRIIGWYKNATVHRYHIDDGKHFYNIEAKFEDAVLLRPKERTFIIPRASKHGYGFGQSNVWYGQGEKNRQLVQEAVEFIKHYERDHFPMQRDTISVKK